MIGFLLVDKPAGPTSHDVVGEARRRLQTRRVGHAGTLDPPATGLLVLGVGPATRLLRFVQEQPKVYEATGVLGVRTTTLDAQGEVVSEEPVAVSEAQLRSALTGLTGDIQQVPPAVSAVKVGGERAYARAARGEQVELKARPVTVYSLDLLSFETPAFKVRISCSGGTYVRSLVADAGDAVGCGAHVRELRRTRIGSLDVNDAVSPGAITPDALVAVEDGLRDMARIEVGEEAARDLAFGRRVDAEGPSGEVLVVGPRGPVGVGARADGILRPVVVLPA